MYSLQISVDPPLERDEYCRYIAVFICKTIFTGTLLYLGDIFVLLRNAFHLLLVFSSHCSPDEFRAAGRQAGRMDGWGGGGHFLKKKSCAISQPFRYLTLYFVFFVNHRVFLK